MPDSTAEDNLEACCLADGESADALSRVVFAELRSLAAMYLRAERSGHTLQPTALVNEAYLKLADQVERLQTDRARFFSVAAMAMRHVLVDHARRRNSLKRGGGRQQVTLHEAVAPQGMSVVDVLALDDAMRRLGERNERMAKVVEMRFFAGLTISEVAGILGVSSTTVDNDWYVARAWLARELDGNGPR